jgi:hypothetical protein
MEIGNPNQIGTLANFPERRKVSEVSPQEIRHLEG